MNRHDLEFEVYGTSADEIESKVKLRADAFYGKRPYRFFIQSVLLWQKLEGDDLCKASVSATDADV